MSADASGVPEAAREDPARRDPVALAADGRLRSIGLFIELEKRARHAEDEAGFCFFVVNETFNLARYRQALLWRIDAADAGVGKLIAVSGLAAPDPNAPFVQWSSALCAELARAGQDPLVRPVTPAEVSTALAADWERWLPAHALCLDLHGRGGTRLGLLLLARDEPWGDAERHLLGYLADAYGHAWDALAPRRTRARGGFGLLPRRWQVLLGAGLLALGMVPVSQTALAPAEVVAVDPAIVRAPIDGVAERFAVTPNTLVKKDEVLLYLDATKLDSRLKVAQKALEVSRAELRQAEQQALFDEATRVNLAILRSRVQQQAAEVEYVRGLLARSSVRSPRDGMAVFDDVNDWIGKPVAQGERIMMIADPGTTEIEIKLPVADALNLKEKARVRLFLNNAPHRPVEGELRYVSYEAGQTPEGFFAYRLIARVTDRPADLRIGLKGTAKIYGDDTVLGLYLLRKPIVAVRQHLGV